VVVSVKAASVNFPDVLIIENKYQFKPPLPFSPGSELAGIVKEAGADVTHVKPGDRVMAFTVYGAFAEEIVLDAFRVLAMPEGMDFSMAAAFLLTYGTMDHALRDRGALKANETVLVLGAGGGIGIASIDIAKALGARVIACASSAALTKRSTTRTTICVSGSKRSPTDVALMSPWIRLAVALPSRRCVPWHGAAACS
jgi:NADPH2:quinone reductase